MKTRTYLPALLFAASAALASCGEGGSKEGPGEHSDSSAATASGAPAASGPVTVTDFPQSPDFPGAALSLADVSPSASGDSVKLSFAFEVRNYELKAQTADAANKGCSNSAQGQHIHFIIDNKPYVALYEPKHEVTVAKNSEHYVLCFLSRSYHESLKGKGASLLYHFRVDQNGKLEKLPEPRTPMVFYSRPKGDYLGKDTENVLFDFYVWNGTLGNDLKVKADISSGGKDTSLMLSQWKPYNLKNLAMGKNTIRLTLVDASGNKVAGPETEVSRDFQLAQGEPMK